MKNDKAVAWPSLWKLWKLIVATLVLATRHFSWQKCGLQTGLWNLSFIWLLSMVLHSSFVRMQVIELLQSVIQADWTSSLLQQCFVFWALRQCCFLSLNFCWALNGFGYLWSFHVVHLCNCAFRIHPLCMLLSCKILVLSCNPKATLPERPPPGFATDPAWATLRHLTLQLWENDQSCLRTIQEAIERPWRPSRWLPDSRRHGKAAS